MEYPIWHLTTWAGGAFIALTAVLHVFIAHLAVGGGLFLPVLERLAYKRGSEAILDYVKKHTMFFLLATMVFGGMSGVGIWFTISVISPRATSTLIHLFVFGWATEWVFFVAEITALLIYHYRFGKMARRDHLIVGWLYFLFAFMSLLLINAIVGFMLNPGDWLQTGTFWDAFFNPAFWPSLLFRTFMAFMIAGLFGFVTAHRIKDAEAKEAVIRQCALWTVVSVVLALPCGLWYYSLLPAEAIANLSNKVSLIATFYKPIPYIAAALFVLGAGMMVKMSGKARIGITVLLLCLGLSFIGTFEFLREASRKPWLIHEHMYSTQIMPSEMAGLNAKGVLPSSKWSLVKDTSDPYKAGAEMYQIMCASCHSVGGPINDILHRTKTFNVEDLTNVMPNLHQINTLMPPFAGTLDERRALATYIVKELR